MKYIETFSRTIVLMATATLTFGVLFMTAAVVMVIHEYFGKFF